MKHTTNSARWVSRISDVMKTLDSDLYTPESNKTTGAILESCRKRLASGQSLSAKQASALVEAIRIRADSTFQWEGEITITENQLKYARRAQPWFFAGTKATAPELSEFVTRREMNEAIMAAIESTKVEMLDLFQRTFIGISSDIQPDFNSLSSHFHPTFNVDEMERPSELNDSSLGVADFTLKHNITKLNQTNGVDELPIIASQTPSEKPIKRAITHKGSLTHPDDKKKSRDNGNGARADERTVSLFQQNADSAPSGNLELDGEKFHLVFGSYEKQFDRISKVSSPEWVKAFDAEQGRIARDMERHACARWTLSPVFSEGDTHGYQAPLANSAVILCWNGPLIEGCWLVVFEDELVFQPINFRKSKTLIWKGQPQQQTQLAA